MSEEGKVRQITKTEAKEIDPKKVAYFTLNDGTVFIVKDNINQENTQIQQEQITTENDQVNMQTQNTNIQQESNYKYYIANQGETIQQNQGYFNARLISAKIIGNNSLNLNQGSKRQLYKLIEAVPVRFYDVQGTQFINQSNNSQINLQQYNNDTYIVQKATKESNYQINTQSSGNQCTFPCGAKNEKKCCCPLGCPEMNEEYEIVSKEYFEQCMKMKKK